METCLVFVAFGALLSCALRPILSNETIIFILICIHACCRTGLRAPGCSKPGRPGRSDSLDT
jgi:hypothetical protein